MNAQELPRGERWLRRLLAGSLVAIAMGLVGLGLVLYV